jgi:antitoxin component YwqK of YwqJK toxin-antitoxin module
MVKPKLISVTLCVLLFIIISVNCYSQSNNIQISINDSLILKKDVAKCKKIEMKSDSNSIIDVLYYQNGLVRNIFLKKGENSYLKLGFSYTGILISQAEYTLLIDKVIPNGPSYHYTDDGNLSHIYTYLNGELNGTFKSYHSNGIMESIGEYVNGEKKGKWTYYSIKGVLVKSVLF